jgi:chemotaxis protein methyltransferase CheR
MTDERDDNHVLSTKEFAFICQFTHKATGIVLNESKREMVYRRFTRIIRERKLKNFSEYCDLLRNQTALEESYFINAITTNLTSFFREKHHFDYLQQHEIPKIIDQGKNSAIQDKRLRIWSCASSTGEEPYSIAITILEAMQAKLSEWDVKILATDVDSNVLKHASKGVYDEKSIEDLPEKIKHKYFLRGKGKNIHSVKVNNELKSLITFKHLNLLHDWPMGGPFDVIFCRNVIIYFDKSTQQELFSHYYELLKPGGLLMLGHSENLGEYNQYFSNTGRTTYRKPSLSNELAVGK